MLCSNPVSDRVYSIELIEASREFRKPRAGFATFFDHPNLMPSLALHKTPDHRLSGLGQGFVILDRFPDVSLEDRMSLRHALLGLILYTLGVDNFLTKAYSPHDNLADLGEQRNFVHHELLSSLPVPDPQAYLDRSQATLVYAITQLAAVVYSFLCVFPLAAAPFDLAARQTLQLLQSRDMKTQWSIAPELHVWILYMVGIAATGSQSRTSVVKDLRSNEVVLRIDTWGEMKMVLMKFLWLPATNDVDGELLWDETMGTAPHTGRIRAQDTG